MSFREWIYVSIRDVCCQRCVQNCILEGVYVTCYVQEVIYSRLHVNGYSPYILRVNFRFIISFLFPY